MKYIVQPVVPAHAAMPQYATERRYTIVSAQSGLVASVREGSILLEQQNWVESERQQWRIERIPDGINADLLAIDREGQLYKRLGWHGEWEIVTGGPSMRGLVVTREGRLLGVGADQQLYRRENLASPWELIPESGPTLDAAILPNGHIVGVSPDGELLMRPSLGEPWQVVPGEAPIKAVATQHDGAILAVREDGQMIRREALDRPWEIVSAADGMLNITTMVDGAWLGVGADHRLTIRTTAGEPWSPVPGAGEFIAVAAHARYYRLINVHSGKVMDVKEWSLDGGAAVHEWPWHGDLNQQWAVQHIGGGTFKIVARVSGLTLDVQRGDPAPGTPLIQYRWHGGLNQQWRLAEVKDGAVLPFSGRATIYEFANYEGRSLEVGLGSYDAAELAIGDGTVGSIRIPEGMRVTLYENANFSGERRRFEEDAAVVDEYFYERTKGIAVEQVTTIFDQPLFQGRREKLGIGRYKIADLEMDDDSVRSLRVPSGLLVTLFENDDYSGRPRVYTSDAETLDDMMDGVVSSITVKAMGIVIPSETISYGEQFSLELEELGGHLHAAADGVLRSGQPHDPAAAAFLFTRLGDSKFAAYASFGDVAALTDHAGRFARLRPDGELRCDAETAGEAARLIIVRVDSSSHNSFVASGDAIALRTDDGRYLVQSEAAVTASGEEPHATRGRWRLRVPLEINAEEVPPGEISDGCGVALCGSLACGADFCGAAACGSDACGAAACGADGDIIGVCGAAATAIGFCALDVAGAAACGAAVTGVGIAGVTVCGADACGAAACGAEACGGAACGAAACGAAACGLDADIVIGICALDVDIGGICGAEACGSDVCGAEAGGGSACGAQACGAAACGTEACGAEACAAEACPVEACPADACLANACVINLCPADACLADACVIDFIPIIPGI